MNGSRALCSWWLLALLAGGTTIMANGTKLSNISQPPLSTTMMGVLKGVADHHGLQLSEPSIFGLSGHAFIINIHTQLCPSGPYCWKRENAKPLIENMGLRMTDLGFFGTGAEAAARATVESTLRQALDRGIPCSMINLENQIIDGYDDAGFFTAQPWAPQHKFPPATLSFGSWQELGAEFHVNFYTIEKVEPADRRAAVLASLAYAIDMWHNPARHSSEAYGAGPQAYDNWIAAVPTAGASHGNWWNATVWSECRRMAAAYFAEIGAANESASALCKLLERQYLEISGNLKQISDKKLDPAEKIRLLQETKELEAAAIAQVTELAAALGAANTPNPGASE